MRRSAVVKAVLRLEPRQQLLRPFDRPRHQLREIGHKQRKIKKVMLRLHFPPVHIDGVAEGLERVERDAHRQNDIQHRRGKRDRHRSAERRERRAEEIEILEEKQQPQIHRQTDRQKELLLLCSPLHAEGTEVVHRRRIQDQHDEFRLPTHVKIIACRQQEVFPPPVRQGPVEQEYHRKKHQKLQGVEQHCLHVLRSYQNHIMVFRIEKPCRSALRQKKCFFTLS